MTAHPNLEINGQTLRIGNITKIFKNPIEEAKWTDYGILVTIYWTPNVEDRNIFLIDENGQEIWQIAPIGNPMKTSYTGFYEMPDGNFDVTNMAGYRCRLDMNTGNIEILYFHPYA